MGAADGAPFPRRTGARPTATDTSMARPTDIGAVTR
ncbi:hypothetical protein SAMN05421678_108236 [Actinopolymorpha cephalotaxi]|uniref:Uncharacterized protein n=1 Tax=Actinopolymorpha cephalotaxi TaxID=504797 RepID=A0A1I2UPE0_9ACTN|nr:hypothetical protein [Actinopolymorpha cephalotaxi]SFG78109.1 hypothetical protein SAMN05421678_108236 [Actinopolymorpha cephalotaxi]